MVAIARSALSVSSSMLYALNKPSCASMESAASAVARVKVVTADGTGPRLPLLFRLVPLEGPFHLALRAIGMFTVRGITPPPEGFQACGVIGVLLHEFHEGILRLRRCGSFWVVPVGWRHNNYSLTVPSLT